MLTGEGVIAFKQGCAIPSLSEKDGLLSTGMTIHKVREVVLGPMNRPQLRWIHVATFRRIMDQRTSTAIEVHKKWMPMLEGSRVC